MYVDVGSLDRKGRYAALTDVIVPRPIAWVLTDNGAAETHEDRWNVAPFSYFTGACSDPAQVMFSVGHSLFDGRSRKDTYANLLEVPECVVHIPSVSQAVAVEHSARTYAHGESEISHLGLDTAEFDNWPIPRIAGAAIAMACRAHRFIPVAEGESQMVIVATVERIFIADEVTRLDSKSRQVVDLLELDPAARAGWGQYVGIKDPFTVTRYPTEWSDRRGPD